MIRSRLVGEVLGGRFLLRGLQTSDGRIHGAPPDLVAALPEALVAPLRTTDEFPLLLISGARRPASYNTWTQNIPALMEKMKGNWATLNPEDARRLSIENGSRVKVRSASGSVEIAAVVSDEVRPGVVVIHQFWGHNYDSGTRASRRCPGVNVNILHDDRVRDRFCGMPVFNGTPCRVEVARCE